MELVGDGRDPGPGGGDIAPESAYLPVEPQSQDGEHADPGRTQQHAEQHPPQHLTTLFPHMIMGLSADTPGAPRNEAHDHQERRAGIESAPAAIATGAEVSEGLRLAVSGRSGAGAFVKPRVEASQPPRSAGGQIYCDASHCHPV